MATMTEVSTVLTDADRLPPQGFSIVPAQSADVLFHDVSITVDDVSRLPTRATRAPVISKNLMN
jgi:hypothetical protein